MIDQRLSPSPDFMPGLTNLAAAAATIAWIPLAATDNLAARLDRRISDLPNKNQLASRRSARG
jgi:hypothetical protein